MNILRKKVIKRLLITFSCLALGTQLSAQVWLDMQHGLGYGSYRDKGASPITYSGVEMNPALSMRVQHYLWEWQVGTALNAGCYSLSLNNFGGEVQLYGEINRQVWCKNNWSILAGIKIVDCFDLRYNGSLGNSSVGMGNFLYVDFIGTARLRLNTWELFGAIAAAPLTAAFRPGFSYMDNYDADLSNTLNNTFAQYQSNVVPMGHLACEWGATKLMNNGNRIRLFYRWDYLSTYNTGYWRFDQATHGLLVELMMSLDIYKK